MSIIGRMDGGFFVSRTELLNWLNSTYMLNVTKVEQCANGAIWCQIIDACHPGAVSMRKVNWAAKEEHQCVANYKVLHAAFDKVCIERNIEVDKLVRGKYQDNLEMLQWIKTYSDRHFHGGDGDYDPFSRRFTEQLPEWARPPDGSRSAARSRGGASDSKAPGRFSPAMRSRVTSSGDSRQVPDRNDLEILKVEHEKLREEVVDLKITVDGLENERDFYFQKLRDVEILLQALEERPDPDMSVSKLAECVQRILYAKDEDDDDEIAREENGVSY
eukprot:TRINITY_DN94280_c0_g1_i1.p1 TRINITY_DN94280_c0_g1~~TRINITY_DN94280_c0_g1_i1.p1  ORF type:complete len:303 (-),score=58.21 TRINITY_DN94280_c0_g1_i1:363-1184(-)